jgi:hypothetical protein
VIDTGEPERWFAFHPVPARHDIFQCLQPSVWIGRGIPSVGKGLCRRLDLQRTISVEWGSAQCLSLLCAR